MRISGPITFVCLIVLGLGHSTAYAEIHKRHVRITVDTSQLTAGTDYVELATGFSDTFKPAQLQGVDMLDVEAEFFDQAGNQLYIVLRDLGGQYLDSRGWQWFQASIALDVGTVSGTYVNGWRFTESLPLGPQNVACCTRTATFQTEIQSAGYGLDVTDSIIAVESMRFRFNFNSYSNPVVITDGGGFNRFSLKIRSENIALVRKPISTPIEGPWDDGGAVIDVDGNGRGSLGKTYDFHKIAVGYGGAQHFLYIVNVFPGMPNVSDLSHPIFLADGFIFDPVGEQNFDSCADGVCDGISSNSNPACLVTISGTKAKKNQIEGRNAVIEILGSFTGQSCRYIVHIATEADGKGRNATYYPSDCRTALTNVGGINSLVKITNGVQIYDNVSQTLLPESLGKELEPIGCP